MPVARYWNGSAWADWPGTEVNEKAGEPASPGIGAIWIDTDAPDPASPLFVTSLPSNPVEGQEVYFRCPDSPWPLWHLRWTANWADAYKWEFIGGSGLDAVATPGQGGSSTNYADFPTDPGPQVVLPLAGDYNFTFGGYSRPQARPTTTLRRSSAPPRRWMLTRFSSGVTAVVRRVGASAAFAAWSPLPGRL